RRALEHHQQSRDIRKAIGDRSGEAAALNRAGVALHKLGEPARSRDTLHEALAIQQELNEASAEADTLLNLAALERDDGHPDAARNAIETALRMTESLRARITDANLRASYVARVQDTYATYVEVLMQLHEVSPSAGHEAAAFEA